MQPPKSDICVICGAKPAETVDHVPPKCFFKGVINSQLPTVPACFDCNNGASSDDEDIRFYISAQIGQESAATKQLWENGAYKSILRKTKLRKEFTNTAREVNLTNKDGTQITRIAYHVPVSTHSRVFRRITRGLYFYHSGRILRPNVPIEVTMLDETTNINIDGLELFDKEIIGEGACIYRYGISIEDYETSVWIFEFYQKHWVLVRTGDINFLS